MGRFSRSTPAEYRLLDRKIPKGGAAFWIRDRASAGKDTFVNHILADSAQALPTALVAFAATAGEGAPIVTRRFDYGDGGCELHIHPPTEAANR